MRNILIIGGTRFVGPPLIEKLLKNGDSVTIFCRGVDYGKALNPKVKMIQGDRDNKSDLKKLTSLKFDLIYDMCCFSEQQAKNLLKATNFTFNHLIFFSTAAVYEKPLILPLNERSKLGEWPSFGDYGTRKAKAEKTFINFAKQNNKKITIFRPVYILGKNNYFDRENYYFSRISKKQSILVPGKGDSIIQFAFLNEVVESFFQCPIKQSAQIEILNVAGNEYISVKAFIELCGIIINKKPKLQYVELESFGLDESRFYDDLYPFPNISLILENTKIKSLYGIRFGGLKEGLIKIHKLWKQNWNGKILTSARERNIITEIKQSKHFHQR